MAKGVRPGMSARYAADLRIAIEREGRAPELVLMVFAEPEAKGQARVRVNEYVRSKANDAAIDAIGSATRQQGQSERVEMVDPYHPGGPNVVGRVTYGQASRGRDERGASRR